MVKFIMRPGSGKVLLDSIEIVCAGLLSSYSGCRFFLGVLSISVRTLKIVSLPRPGSVLQ